MTSLSPSSIAVLAVVALIIFKTLLSRHQFKSKYKFPPAIPGLPIIGNTLDVPFPAGVWGHEMAKKYGEMYVRLLLSTMPHVFMSDNTEWV